jgi:predicted phage tail protein
MSHRHGHQGEDHSEHIGVISTHDPIKKSLFESPRFTYSWLKDGQRLSGIQRFGYGLLSSAYLLMAAFFIYMAILSHLDGSRLSALMAGMLAALLLFLGVKGMRNVLTFARPGK